MENIDADQSYFMDEVNHVDKSKFKQNLTHITPCNPAGFDFSPTDNTFFSFYLHPTHGFQWNKEVVDKEDFGYGGTKGIQPTGWGSKFDDDVWSKGIKKDFDLCSRNKLKAALEAEVKYMAIEAKKI